MCHTCRLVAAGSLTCHRIVAAGSHKSLASVARATTPGGGRRGDRALTAASPAAVDSRTRRNCGHLSSASGKTIANVLIHGKQTNIQSLGSVGSLLAAAPVCGGSGGRAYGGVSSPET